MKIHHIGYLVKSIKKALPEFLAIGYRQETDVILDETRNVEIVFLLKDMQRIELVSPKGKDSAIGNLHKKIGNSPYHICYEVDNLENTIDKLEADGYILSVEPQSAPAIDNKRVAFLFNTAIGLIEIVEVVK